MIGIAFPFNFNAEGRVATRYNEEIMLDKLHLFCLTHEAERVMYYNWSAGLRKILFSSYDDIIKQGLLFYELNLKMKKFFPYLTLKGVVFKDLRDGKIELYLSIEEISNNIVFTVEE